MDDTLRIEVLEFFVAKLIAYQTYAVADAAHEGIIDGWAMELRNLHGSVDPQVLTETIARLIGPSLTERHNLQAADAIRRAGPLSE